MGRDEELNCLLAYQRSRRFFREPRHCLSPFRSRKHRFVFFIDESTFLANFIFPTARNRWQHHFNSQCSGFPEPVSHRSCVCLSGCAIPQRRLFTAGGQQGSRSRISQVLSVRTDFTDLRSLLCFVTEDHACTRRAPGLRGNGTSDSFSGHV